MKPALRSPAQGKQDGFALMVLVALMVSFAMIAVALIDHSNAEKQLLQEQATRAQLSRIATALVKYSLLNSIKPDRYPCPAPYNVLVGGATYGAPIAACETGVHGGMEVLTGVTGDAIRGMVPINVLIPYGADPNDAFDAWNNRIMYVVDRRLTTGGSNNAGTIPPDITVKQTAPDITFRAPDFIVMSYGSDGIGAIAKEVITISIPCTGPNVNNLDHENCNTDNLFRVSATTSTSAASASATGVYFDDLLTFYGR